MSPILLVVIAFISALLAYLFSKHVHSITGFSKRVLMAFLMLFATFVALAYYATESQTGATSTIIINRGDSSHVSLASEEKQLIEVRHSGAAYRSYRVPTESGDELTLTNLEGVVVDHSHVDAAGGRLEVKVPGEGIYYIIQKSSEVREIVISADPD